MAMNEARYSKATCKVEGNCGIIPVRKNASLLRFVHHVISVCSA